MAAAGTLLDTKLPPLWFPSSINGQQIQADADVEYPVANGEADIVCYLQHTYFNGCNPTDYPDVNDMQCSINDEVSNYPIKVQDGVGHLYLKFTKAGTHKVCLGEKHVTIKVTEPRRDTTRGRVWNEV
ncbi:hypothetical protein DPV78_010470 [Talaromyces pinophilus]|nr:hypothetical protein DPV78_010470 [Talaromyces pinophilus]